MTTLGRHPRVIPDSPALDAPYNNLPGVDRDLFVRANIPGWAAASDLAAAGSGVALGVPVWLEKDDVVTSLTFLSGGTAAGTPTNWWFALYDIDGALARQTADQLTAAWAADTAKKLALSSAYTAPKRGWYTAAVMVAATTPPTLAGAAPRTGTAAVFTGSKAFGRTFGSGLTGTAPATISSPTTVAKCPLAIVS